MTPPQRAFPRVAKKSASPAERSAEFSETQRRLKREAADRRLEAARTGRSATPKKRG
jgi:hypothetical protein